VKPVENVAAGMRNSVPPWNMEPPPTELCKGSKRIRKLPQKKRKDRKVHKVPSKDRRAKAGISTSGGAPHEAGGSKIRSLKKTGVLLTLNRVHPEGLGDPHVDDRQGTAGRLGVFKTRR